MSPVLATTGLSVRFRGGGAVDAVGDIGVEQGKLVGLIWTERRRQDDVHRRDHRLSPSTGQVELDGRDLAGLPPHARAQRGLARTSGRARSCSTT